MEVNFKLYNSDWGKHAQTLVLPESVQRGVPRSTAQGWLCPSRREVVTLDVLNSSEKQLQHEVLILRGRNENLRGALRILVAVVRVSGFSLANCRIADSEKKAKLLRGCGTFGAKVIGAAARGLSGGRPRPSRQGLRDFQKGG